MIAIVSGQGNLIFDSCSKTSIEIFIYSMLQSIIIIAYYQPKDRRAFSALAATLCMDQVQSPSASVAYHNYSTPNAQKKNRYDSLASALPFHREDSGLRTPRLQPVAPPAHHPLSRRSEHWSPLAAVPAPRCG